ncbi:GCN5-related N-acetyltransferase [alpha proteobacterium U9-1i]|nr:GCN5-related N-acetyltransferase [alpha proteobacterium U9-1i]
MSRPALLVRPCFQQDLGTVQLIYAHHVTTGTGSFELDPPNLEEMTARWTRIVEKGWPFLVATPTHDLSRVLGYAYATQFRDRPGYAKTFEVSVYVAPSSQRQGAGVMLLGELLTMLRGDGVREALAVIGDSENAASIALHKKAGFEPAGLLKGVGEKFGRVLDVVIMQRRIPPRTS